MRTANPTNAVASVHRGMHGAIAALVLALQPTLSTAALTDLATTPIGGTTLIQTKPNIMLLMDASGSMGWTHMPDEVESITGVKSIGYKSAQCNSLYYNPTQTYLLPKLPDGTPFTAPSFGLAPYSGYASYFTAPDATDLSVQNLGAAFRAYDKKTLRLTSGVPADKAQAAYYYVYSGPQTLGYASAACRQADVDATVAATGGGLWTRVDVSTESAVQQQNFAIWYSFYRTRISLIKSAASLAFTPLTDSYRVGFITVEPKDTPTSPAINPGRYVAIDDFTLPQRNTWFSKLFSQIPDGASPAREGLARVGRHYAGKQDGINTGMTGDPVQFTCQQNFTIMTTDGYWNSQTETPGPGGGPTNIAGTAHVGQQDGSFTPAAPGLTPRPIWEGFSNDTQIQTDKDNLFSYVPCGSYFYISTVQWNASTTQTTTTTNQMTMSTSQVNVSTSQASASTSQRTVSTLQHTQSTNQISRGTVQWSASTSQIRQTTSGMQEQVTQQQQRTEQVFQSTAQRIKSTSQDTISTSQLQESTVQIRVATSRVDRSTNQITTSTSQLQQTTTQSSASTSQLTRSTDQLQQSTTQQFRSTSQLNSCDAQSELCTPVPVGSCSAAGYITCEMVTTGPTAVASCVPDPVATSANNYTVTTCATTTTGPVGVATCTTAAPNAGNGFVATSCATVSTPAVGAAVCTPAVANAGNNYTATNCNTVTTGPTLVAGCTPVAANAGNSFTATTCGTVTTGPTGVGTCTPALANAGNGYVATTCNTATTGPTGTSSCTAIPASAGNFWLDTTCNTVTTGPVPVSSCTAATANAGNSWVDTTCTPVNSGPTGAASCTATAGTSGNSWTTTTCPNITTPGVGVPTCTTIAPTSGNGYTQTNCNTALTGPTGVPAGSCVVDPASAGNSWTATSCATVTTGPTPLAAASCPGDVAASAGNSYVATTCATNSTGPTLVASCNPVVAGSANAYTATTCSTTPPAPAWVDVGACVPSAANAGNGYTATYCRVLTVSTTPVATCTPSPPNGAGVGVVCNTTGGLPVPVASCTPQTAAAGNGWTTITCATLTTGPTLVATCTPASAASGNAYTDTTCSSVTTGPTLVASCTPDVATSGNGFVATTCSTATTGPTGVSSCTPVGANSGNMFTSTTCLDVSTGPTPTSSCTAIPASSGNSWVDTTCNTVTSGPTLMASCTAATASLGNSWTDTSCATVTTGPTPTNVCVNQSPTSANSYVSTSCNTVTTPATGVASCTPDVATSANNWTATICTPVTTVTGTDSCTTIPPSSGNGYVATSCNTVSTGPTLVASCMPATANAGNSYTATTCNSVTTGPTVTSVCTPATANAGNNYTATTCTTAGGRKIQYTTTTTITTTPYSGGFPSGTPVVNTSTSGPTNLDGVCYALGNEPALPAPNPQKAGFAAGPPPPSGCTGWPCTTSTANAGGSVDSLADVAQYYYVTDLRPGPLWVNNVLPNGASVWPEGDWATWQHMTTFTVALGVSGTLQYQSDYKSASTLTGDFAHIRTGSIPTGDTSGTGAINWPVWPDPALNYDGNAGGNFTLWNNPKSIDDFWHTAVNGRGTYFNANDPKTVIQGLSDALSGIDRKPGSGAGVAVSNFTPVANDNFVYSPSYLTADWTGNLVASEIDPAGVISATPLWSAQALLDARVGAACDSRNIYLIHPGAPGNKVDFTWNTQSCAGGPPTTGLDTVEQANFGGGSVALLSQYLAMSATQRTAAAGASLVNFLRGQSGAENFTPDDDTKLFRKREAVLGDIVGGQPVYVKAPFGSYTDPGYDAFKIAQALRVPMIYVPANDGMLHAFYATTSTTDPLRGQEAWAMIPSTVLKNLYHLADNNYKNTHQFFVDGTPIVGDAYDGSAWKTVLVAGLSGGGRGYYAIDVTDPVAPKALWEFKWDPAVCPLTSAAALGNTADCHLGYTYGKPLLSKLTDGSWVIMFTSGYNNVNAPTKPGDGIGYLYVLDAFSGRIRYKISTGAGGVLVPSGLAQINNFVDDSLLNNTTKQVYGGDLLGNVWRFDVNDTIAPGGREATLVGVASDPGGVRQPITAKPELAELNGKPMVFVGTGKLLGITDLTNVQPQSVYGIVDPLVGSPVYPAPMRSALKKLTLVGGATRTVSCIGTCASVTGWVIDLPATGERMNIDMQLARGTLVFATNIPVTNDACKPQGQSWLNYVSFSSGLGVTSSPGLAASLSFIDRFAVGLSLVDIQGQLYGPRRLADGTNAPPDTVAVAPTNPTGKRITWREISQ